MNSALKRTLQIILVIATVAGVLAYREGRSQANIGAGYVAHQICSCVFVAGRSYASCLPDMLPSMGRIQSEVLELDGQNGARGWIPLFADRTALHTPGFGCSLD
jgi:hypothetical protein